MISIIVCSKAEVLLNMLKKSIENTIGIKYELIVKKSPNGEMGIAQAYNLAANEARFPFLIFVHEDVKFHSIDWGEKIVKHLEENTIGLIGVVGTKVKTLAPSGAWLNNYMADRFFMIQGSSSGDNYVKYANPLGEKTSEVKILDGLFLCCRKNVWEENKFDELNFKNFHGYDIDFSLQIQQKFKLYVIYDVKLEHLSNGGNSKTWVEAMTKITKKWEHILPTYVMAMDNNNLLSIEYKALDCYLRTLIQNKCFSLNTVLTYLKMLYINLFNLNNLKVVKYFFKNI